MLSTPPLSPNPRASPGVCAPAPALPPLPCFPSAKGHQVTDAPAPNLPQTSVGPGTGEGGCGVPFCAGHELAAPGARGGAPCRPPERGSGSGSGNAGRFPGTRRHHQGAPCTAREPGRGRDWVSGVQRVPRVPEPARGPGRGLARAVTACPPPRHRSSSCSCGLEGGDAQTWSLCDRGPGALSSHPACQHACWPLREGPGSRLPAPRPSQPALCP